MVKISVVKFKQVLDEQRLNAENFDEEIVKLEKISTIRLNSLLSEITSGMYIDTYTPKGRFYLRVNNLKKYLEYNLEDVVFVNENITKFPKKIITKKGDILISKTGTIGLIVEVDENLEGSVISQHLIRIKLKENVNYKKFFLIYLSTRQIQNFMLKGTIGGTHKELLLNTIKKIPIINFSDSFKKYIEQLVEQAYEKRKLAKQKYQQAEQLLYQLLGVRKEEIEKLETEIDYEVNFKDVKKAFRFDAEYYHPKYLGVIELLRKTPFELKSLKEVVKISNETIDPTKEPYRSRRFKYVPIAKINESGEIFEWEEFYGWQAPSRARMVIRKDDILVPSLIETFDKIALVPEELDGHLATTGCFVVRAKDDYPEFLFLLLRTPLFIRQLEQQTTGAIMSAVPKTVFGNLLVPIIPKDKQREIANLVREYFKLRKESIQLIQRAIRKTEKMIEHASKNIK